MAIHIDRKFLHLLSPKLDRFVQKKPDLYNFRCPYCGDSTKKVSKSRGYVYRKRNDYYYKCHNCGVGHTFYNFLKSLDPTLIKEYTLERYKNGEDGNHNYPKMEFDIPAPIFNISNKKVLNIPSIQELPEGHFAKQYILERKIPSNKLKNIYFTENFSNLIESLNADIDIEKLPADPRIILPFFDKDDNLTIIQGRSFTNDKILRYITVKIVEDSVKIFNLNKVDRNKKVYVVEGPIDSLFLNNSVATSDSNLQLAVNYFDDYVLIYDNQPRNKEIVKQIQNAVKNNYNVCIWPETIDENYKDINEMILGGYTPEQIKQIVDNNTFYGLRAHLEFNRWKKC